MDGLPTDRVVSLGMVQVPQGREVWGGMTVHDNLILGARQGQGRADLGLLSACFRAYNDWLVDFSRTDPARLQGIALINIEDVDEAIRELGRARPRDLAGGMITVAPPEERSYDHPMYEPFWPAAQDRDAPISLHVDTNRPSP